MVKRIVLDENARTKFSRLDIFLDFRRVFAANVRRFRNDRGLTQEQLGEKAGISSTYVSKVERSVSFPTLDIIVKIAEALEISPAELFNELDIESVLYIYTDLEKSPRRKDKK